MSVAVPLAVALSTGRVTDRYVTRGLRDLVFSWSDPGGYRTCRMALDRPLSIDPDEISYYGAVVVYDRLSGETVWEGRLEDPGRSARDGQVFDLVALGGQAHTRDRTVPLVYADRQLRTWRQSTFNHAAARVSISGEQIGVIQIQVPRGTVCATSFIGDVSYQEARNAGQKLARVSCDWDAGRTDANWVIKLQTRTDSGGSPGPVATAGFSTAGGSIVGKVGDTNFSASHNVANLRIDRDVSSITVGDDDTWATFGPISVRAMLVDASGADITSGYTTDYVLAHEIVTDLLGRLLPAYDGPGASIATTTHQIQQLAYPDGVTPERVLQDLMGLEAGHTWRVWERNSSGLYRFEWAEVPDQVRYEATVNAGDYDSTGSADGIYNAVTVRWRDSTGHPRTVERTATVPALTDAGLTRQALLDLGDEVGSQADAERAGDQWLADHAFAPNAGRLRITAPIVDYESGRMVAPWKIRPGLIRVRGIQPRVDALNATSRDGQTVFRVINAEYRLSDASVTLELDSYAPSQARMLAGLSQALTARGGVLRRR